MEFIFLKVNINNIFFELICYGLKYKKKDKNEKKNAVCK